MLEAPIWQLAEARQEVAVEISAQEERAQAIQGSHPAAEAE